MNIPTELKIGDICLYDSSSITDKVIDVKTGDDVSHIEIYAGNGQSWASRNGIGVGLYPFRPDGLKYVRRPLGFESAEAETYFKSVNGAPYGWGDILASADISTALPGMDCSHFAANIMERGFCGQFDHNYDKRKITPRDFKLSNQSDQIWPESQTA